MTAWQGFSRFLGDRRGNFGMMTAILLPVLLGAGGIAMDVTNMMISKTQLQDAADAAALAASTALAKGEAADEAAARKLARDFFIGQISNSMGDVAADALADAVDIRVTTTTKNNGKSFKVQVGSTYDLALTPLMGVLGYQTVDIAVNSASTSGAAAKKRALTMALILDESGSMYQPVGKCVRSDRGKCREYDPPGVNKHAALEAAATALFKALDQADPDEKLVRTVVYTYDQEMVSNSVPGWGTTAARKEVREIADDDYGTTNATEPLGAATTDIKRNEAETDTESSEHRKKDNTEVDRYIVFMTDGEMTDKYGSPSSKIDGEVRQKCDAAKEAKIHIYSVALKAPENGKALLNYCASSSSDYFEAETMDKLIEAFSSIAQKATKDKTLLTN